MSKFSISWTPITLRCLDDIFEYIREESKSIRPAKRFVIRIIKSTNQLKRFPLYGPIETMLIETNQDSRYLIEANYMIIYQIEKSEIVITDIFHVKQNPSK